MVLKIFEGARDFLLERNEKGVTANKTGESVYLPAINECNVLVTTEGLNDGSELSIKFEESENGTDFNEVGTFPVPESRHGILFAKQKDYVRYSLIVGEESNLDVTINF